jgi:YD repeat-containing protein
MTASPIAQPFIDLPSGQVAFTLPLATLTDPIGPAASVVLAYCSDVQGDVTTWNLERPTGVAGLGWRLVSQSIAVNADGGVELVVDTKRNPLLQTGTDSDGALIYQSADYLFWKIRYDPARERWDIVGEDGMRSVYGDADSGRATVQWGVAWGGWAGSSSDIVGQRPVATVWNLSEVVDLWGNTVRYSYRQDTVPVGTGGLSYTQASYLTGIAGATGGRIELGYLPKASQEYQDPHAGLSPNAWQSRYQTQYLLSVSVVSPSGMTLATTTLTYAPNFLGADQFAKRLLTGWVAAYPGGESRPNYVFSYDTVTGHATAGMMTGLTTPDGRQITFAYTPLVVGNSARSVSLPMPVASGLTFSQPRLWFERDYVVVTWLRSDSKAQILAYTWSGRWLAASLDLLPVGSAYAQLQVAVAPNSFAVTAGASVVAYAVNPAMSGTWISSGILALTLTAGEPVQIAAGDGIVAVLGVTSGKLNPLLWIGQSWQQQTVTDLSAGATDLVVSLSATDRYIIAGATSMSMPLIPATLYLMRRDAQNVWQQTRYTVSRAMAVISSLSVACSEGFAAIWSRGPVGANVRLRLGVLDWAGDFASPTFTDLADQTYATAAVPPVAVHGSSVAMGQVLFRYDGAVWSSQDLSAISYSGQSSVTSISCGPDRVVRTIAMIGGGATFDVIDYAPNLATAARPWSAVLTATASSASYAASAARSGGRAVGSNYVLFNSTANTVTSNAIYYRLPNGSWNAPQLLPDALTAGDLPSLQILDQRYCIYQSGGNTVIYPLANGGVASTGRMSLTGQQIMVPDAAPTLLVGPTAFAAYSGTWSTTPSLTLYRVVGNRTGGTQSVEVIDTVACNDGYGTVTTAYGFTASTATIDIDGERAGFNQVASAIGATGLSVTPYGSTVVNLFNDLTPADPVNPVYPNRNNWSNAATSARLLQGRCYQTQILPASGSPANSVDTIYWWAFAHLLGGTGNREGFYKRMQARTRVLDGVTTTTQFAFASESGLTSTETLSRFNSLGVQETLVTAYTYWWQQYDPQRTLNLLTPVIETINTTNGVATGIVITAWRNDWGSNPGCWAPSGTFIATQTVPQTFNHWSPTTAALAAGWQMQSTVLARSPRGVATRAANAIGTPNSSVLDATGSFTVASFANADTGLLAASYYGFEPYEANTSWSYLGGNLAANITTAQSHTGSRSLALTANANAIAGPTATFLATTADGTYVFSCWMLIPTGFISNPTNAQWSLQVYTAANPPVAVGSPVTLPFPAGASQWQYLSTTIDLGTIRSTGGIGANVALSLTITGFNKVASSGTIYIDEMRFSPVDASYRASVYDTASFATSAKLAENGATQRMVRDGTDEVVAIVGPGDNVAGISVPAYARAMTANGVFDPNLPNSLLNLRSSAPGVYFDFDPSDASAWTLPSGWSVAQRQLAYDGVASSLPGSQAVLTGFSNANYAARVAVRHTGTAPPASIGCGNVYAGWDPSQNAWVLSAQESGVWTTQATRTGSFGSEWLFLMVDGLVSLFVSGNEVFSLQLPIAVVPDGTLKLGLGGAGAFAELAVAVDPMLDIGFYDGAGRFMQRLQLADNSALVASGVLYDAIGRAQYDKNPLDSTLAIGAPASLKQGVGAEPDEKRIDGALTAYLPYLDDEQMTLAQYVDPANGSPFHQTAYEATPLSRPTALAWPGPTLAMGSGHAASLSYGCNQAGDFLQSLLPPNAPGAATGSYYLRQLTDPDGRLIQQVSNQTGQIIAEHLVPPGNGATTSTTFYLYDAAGRLTTTRQPNYYAPPSGSQAATWQIQRTYTFVGALASVTTADSGATQFLYDALGRLRFQLDADGAAQTNPRIVYVLYDGLDRPTEQGWVQAAGVTWATAAANVNNQTWPSGISGAIWYRRLTYDLMPSGASAPNLIGRVSQLAVNSGLAASPAAFDTHAYAYDLAGNIVTITSTVPSFSTTAYQASFTYNNLGQTTGVTYPRPLNQQGQPTGTPTLVTSFYNRLGQLAAVGNAPRGDEVVDPDNPANGPKERYALYRYTADGQVLTESFNNLATPYVRSYQYTPAHWLAGIAGDFYSETVTFGTGGIGGSSTYDGKITAWSAVYRDKPGVDPYSAPVTYQANWTYGYDGQGRLAAAACASPLSGATRTIGSATSPVSYDANGNFKTIPLGSASQQYSYQTGSAPEDLGVSGGDPLPQINDRINLVATTLSAAIAFTDGENRAGWTWGASNGGPSTSQIATWTGPSGPPNNRYLSLGGGSIGHYEFLRFSGPLDATSKLQLQYWLNTPEPFASQSGAAGWYLAVLTASGASLLVQVKDLATGASGWTQFNVPIDVPSLLASMALDAPMLGVTLVLRNAKHSGGSTAGAALQVSAISLVSVAAQNPQPYVYDADGAVTSAPPLQVTTIEYCPVNGLATDIALDRTAVSQVGYCYGADDAVTASVATHADGSTAKALYFQDPDGRRIACFNQPAGAPAPTPTYYIYGTRGPIATDNDDGVCYMFSDRLNSMRVAVDDTGTVCERNDYAPFGEMLHAQYQTTPVGFGFAGQPVGDPAGLVSFMGRLYDPSLRVCLDARAGGDGTPYSMAAGNPVGTQANSIAGQLAPQQAVVVAPVQPPPPPRAPDWHVRIGDHLVGVSWVYLYKQDTGRLSQLVPPKWRNTSKIADYLEKKYPEIPLKPGMRQKDTKIARDLKISIDDFYFKDRHQDFIYLSSVNVAQCPTIEGEFVYVVNRRSDGKPQMVLYPQPLAGRLPDDTTYVRHSQLANGGSVMAAGGIYFSNGVVIVNEESGHYAPWSEYVLFSMAFVNLLGFADVYNINFRAFDTYSRATFLSGRTNATLEAWFKPPESMR